MNAMTRNALSAYEKTGIESALPEADGHKLIQMLFEGALKAIADAKLHLTRGAIAQRGMAISKAISIVDQGLRVSLDMKRGGELAERLASLYEYVCTRLLDANVKAEAKPLDEAAALLGELQGAWNEIGNVQAAAAVRG